MSDILNKNSVLRLNGNMMRIGWATPAEAFVAMMGEATDGSPPATALDIHYKLDENGKPILDKMDYFQELEWEYWMILEPREGLDTTINTAHAVIRVPTVIVCPKFRKMPMKQIRATKRAIRERDGNRCAYTGVLLTNKTASIDHIVPISKGGSKTSWTNQVACDKKVNTQKGNRFNNEVGLKLMVTPYEPHPMPLCSLVVGEHHPDHKHF